MLIYIIALSKPTFSFQVIVFKYRKANFDAYLNDIEYDIPMEQGTLKCLFISKAPRNNLKAQTDPPIYQIILLNKKIPLLKMSHTGDTESLSVGR